MGPDLANIGVRQPDAQWHLNHLYNPKSTAPSSTMPPYKILFEERRVDGEPSVDALRVDGNLVAPKGKSAEDAWQVVPTAEARELVAYLISLRSVAPVFEAPLPPEPEETNAAPAAPINPEDFE
jgi:cytochrome c oxidase cbb3-type subunit 2